ncbi:hypothetical protein ACNKHK_22840 [Shigella flexneri]
MTGAMTILMSFTKHHQAGFIGRLNSGVVMAKGEYQWQLLSGPESKGF